MSLCVPRRREHNIPPLNKNLTVAHNPRTSAGKSRIQRLIRPGKGERLLVQLLAGFSRELGETTAGERKLGKTSPNLEPLEDW